MLTEALDRLAKACRILEMAGHGDLSLGHLSLRDPEGRGFWMKRNRAGLGEIMGPRDFVLLSFSGEKLAGEGGRHSEWPIHSEILKCRPDVQVVAHTHALHASVFSGGTESLLPYTLDADYFADLPRHADDVALVTTVAEGAALAESLGPHFAVLMANHGITFCGTSIEHATCVGVFLEKACRAHLLGRSAGLQPNLLSAQTRAKRHAQIMTPAHVEHSWDYLCRMLG
jgi:ribulose-5-phosphate 4-epimerase/fuculose-1-phosphate aldolase